MMGRNHLIAGSALGIGVLSTTYALTDLHAGLVAKDRFYTDSVGAIFDVVGDIARWMWSWMVPYEMWTQAWWLFSIGAVLVFWLGCLMPDIDNPTSMLGRYLRIDMGPHHGITHTDWIPIVLVFLMFLDPTRLVFYFLLGMITHNELDGRSHAGRVRFWPLGRWKTITYDDGVECVVRQKYRRFTYKAGSTGELVYVFLSVLLGFIGVLFMMWMKPDVPLLSVFF